MIWLYKKKKKWQCDRRNGRWFCKNVQSVYFRYSGTSSTKWRPAKHRYPQKIIQILYSVAKWILGNPLVLFRCHKQRRNNTHISMGIQAIPESCTFVRGKRFEHHTREQSPRGHRRGHNVQKIIHLSSSLLKLSISSKQKPIWIIFQKPIAT